MAIFTSIASLAILLSSLLSLSSSLSNTVVNDAAEILSDAGYVSMSLTLLSLISHTQTLDDSRSSLTVFAPSDAAFSAAGQPPLSLLRRHFSPLALPAGTLRFIPAGAEIPTLFHGRNLVLTSSDSEISVNGVSIAADSPIFDTGELVVYGIDRFFNPSFDRFSDECESRTVGAMSWLREASESLRMRGFSAAAEILDVQVFAGGTSPPGITVFAPPDQAVADRIGQNESTASLMFLRHVAPCRLLSSDLAAMNFTVAGGAVFSTFAEGFKVVVSRFGDDLSVNGIQISERDIYIGDSIAVHGLSGIITDAPV